MHDTVPAETVLAPVPMAVGKPDRVRDRKPAVEFMCGVRLQEVLSVCAVSLVHGSYGPQYPHSAAGDAQASVTS